MAPYGSCRDIQVNSSILPLARYKCRVCGEIKPKELYSNKELQKYQGAIALGKKVNEFTSQLTCRLCKGDTAHRIECAKCSLVKSIDEFSRAQRASGGGQWCMVCVAWRESAQAGITTRELVPDAESSIQILDAEDEGVATGSDSDGEASEAAYTLGNTHLNRRASIDSWDDSSTDTTSIRGSYAVPSVESSGSVTTDRTIDTWQSSGYIPPYMRGHGTGSISGIESRQSLSLASSTSNPYESTIGDNSSISEHDSVDYPSSVDIQQDTRYDISGRAHVQYGRPSVTGSGISITAARPSNIQPSHDEPPTAAASSQGRGNNRSGRNGKWAKAIGKRGINIELLPDASFTSRRGVPLQRVDYSSEDEM